MSAPIRGLAAIKKYQEEQRQKEADRNRPKAEYFKWPKGVTTATSRFTQELDEGAANYREDRGLGTIVVEHQAPGPEGYKRRANCTLETEGQCYACERHRQDFKEGWRPRQTLYINALVDFGSGPTPVVISRNANSSFVQALIEEAVEENTITAVNYKITKVGEGTTTQWLLKPLKSEPLDDSDATIFDLDETVIRNVEYDRQAEYYGAVYQGPAGGSQANASNNSDFVSASAADAEW